MKNDCIVYIVLHLDLIVCTKTKDFELHSLTAQPRFAALKSLYPTQEPNVQNVNWVNTNYNWKNKEMRPGTWNPEPGELLDALLTWGEIQSPAKNPEEK